MARTESSMISIQAGDSEYAVQTRPQTPPQLMEIEYEISEIPMDDEPMDDGLTNGEPPDHEPSKDTPDIQITEIVNTVEASPSPSGRKARRQTTEIELDQEVLLIQKNNLDGHHPTAQGHLRQKYTEELTEITEIPIRVEDDEATGSRHSSADPETPRQFPKIKNNSQSPMHKKDTWQTISKMSSIIKQEFCVDEKKTVGHAYLLEDTNGPETPFKIGSSQTERIGQRVKDQIRVCHLEGWQAKSFPQFPLRGYQNLEKIAHEELYFMKYSFRCEPCGKKHKEYFRGEKDLARETLEFWAQWLERCEPYDKDGKLLPFWAARLRTFEQKMKHYFKCLEPSCKRGQERIACQACLRAGWKAWTEPTQWDYFLFDMLSPTNFPNICFHLIFWLTVVSVLLSSLPLPGISYLAFISRTMEVLVVGSTYIWVHRESIFTRLNAFPDKQTQRPHERQAKSPRKQSPAAETPRSAPPKLGNDSTTLEQPSTTPVQTSPQGQIPETEPLLDTAWDRSERYSTPDESPSKAAQKRKRIRNSPRSFRREEHEEEIKRRYKLSEMQEWRPIP